MNKKLIGFLLALIVLLVSSASCAIAESPSYTILLDDLYMRIKIPSPPLDVLTRDMAPDDPALAEMGLNNHSVRYYLEEENIYLCATDKTLLNEIVVSMVDGPEGDFNLYDDAVIVNDASLYAKTFMAGHTVEYHDVYAHKQAKFLRFFSMLPDGRDTVCSLSYFTVYRGKSISVTYSSSRGSVSPIYEAALQYIVDSITFADTLEELDAAS